MDRDITLTISACVTAEQKIAICATCENRIDSFTGINSCIGCYEVDGNKFSIYTVHGEEKHTGRICMEAGEPPHLVAQEDRYLDILNLYGDQRNQEWQIKHLFRERSISIQVEGNNLMQCGVVGWDLNGTRPSIEKRFGHSVSRQLQIKA